MGDALVVDERVVIPASELTWTAARAGGPGGQNVNKVASKVELRWDLAASAVVSGEVKARVRLIAGSARMDADGRVRVVSQLTRDQSRNLDDAREKLADIVRAALVRPTVRKATKPSRRQKARRVDDKRVQGQRKRDRSAKGDD